MLLQRPSELFQPQFRCYTWATLQPCVPSMSQANDRALLELQHLRKTHRGSEVVTKVVRKTNHKMVDLNNKNGGKHGDLSAEHDDSWSFMMTSMDI